MEPFIGQISVVGFNFAPRGWALCNGQLLSIAQNQALFSLLGTIYGGDGVRTFGLPDLRGRAAMHVGSSVIQGQMAGQENVTLLTTQIAAHTHATVNALNVAATQANPVGNMWATTGTDVGLNYGPQSDARGVMAVNALQAAGAGQSHNNMHPSTVLNFVIALQGIFPSRN